MNKKNVIITIIAFIIIILMIVGIVFGVKKYISYKNDIKEKELISNQSEDVKSLKDSNFEETKSFFSNYKVLILYFPQVGNLDIISKFIKECTNGDIVAVECNKQYSTNLFEVQKEWENEKITNEHIDITTEIENFDDYDYIFLGWYSLIDKVPMVVQSLFEKYNFNNKEVALFCSIDNSNSKYFSDTDIKDIVPDIKIINRYTFSDEFIKGYFRSTKNWVESVKNKIKENQ